MGILDGLDLPVLNHQQGRAVPKGKSRLQLKAEADTEDTHAEERWKKAIRKRDGMKCRWCKRKVVVALALVPERAECHHVSGKAIKAIRWDVRNGILVCAADHERLTGKVNERFLIVSDHTFTVDSVQYIDGNQRVTFKRIA